MPLGQHVELLERDAQLELLRACAAASAEGPGRIVLVSGEAGIGKTSLVRAVANELARPLWWGACDALQTPQPLAPLHDIARAGNVRFAPLLGLPMRASAVFGEILQELQSLGPALFVVEDTHWADESTLDLIKFVGRRIDRTRALLVVTFRQDEVSASHPLRLALGDLPSSLTERMELPRLSREAVATLAHRALRAPSRLYEASGGNPFFVTELLRHGSSEMPLSVQDLVLSRFARLDEAAREVVQLVAIVPARAERALVEQLLSPRPETIECCLDSGLLVVDAQWLSFRHEIARVAIEGSTSLPLAERYHARMLEALAGQGVPDERAARVVHHATHARARDAVLEFAPLAAREALRRGARREAAAHYRTALRFSVDAPVRTRITLLEAYAVECQATHQLGEAIAAREELAAILQQAGDVRAEGRNLSQLALDLVVALRNAEADASSRRAIALLEGVPPGAELANAYRVEAQLRMLNRDCTQSIAWAGKAIALAGQHGDDEVLAAGHATLGAALLFTDYGAGVACLERALELSIPRGLDYIAANSYSNLGSASGELFRLRAAEKHLQDAIEFSTRKEVDFYRTYALAWLGLCHAYLGRWEDALSQAEEALGTATESSTARVMALCAIAVVRVRRGDADAGAVLDEASQLAWRTGTLQRIAPVQAIRAEAAWQRGDMALSLAEARKALPSARAHRHPWCTGQLAYWEWIAGELSVPAGECAEPFALEMQGSVARAAASWEGLECPYEQARTLARGTAGERIEALAIFERLGARPASDALRRHLRDAGVRGVPRGPRASTLRSSRGLTARESEILELLCEGLRNSEIAERVFRSVRTVEHHVDSILGKLGAKSRSEVAAIARREGLVGANMGIDSTQNS